jgi:aryl-alcohol dehydrogenase-like predicted oxidoreductase
MTFGHQCNEEQSVSILNAAKDHGFTFIDTADVYPIGDMTSGYGATEEILGRWLTGQRDNFILATKCYAPTGPNKWDQGNSRKNIIRAAEESLRRLKTDYIDVYQLHFYDDRVSHDESLSALDDLVRSGKVRYIGCSNYLAYQLATALGRSDVNKWERFASVQPRYNMLFRENERRTRPRSHSVQPTCWRLPHWQAPKGRPYSRHTLHHWWRHCRALPRALLARPDVCHPRCPTWHCGRSRHDRCSACHCLAVHSPHHYFTHHWSK